jgi:hypothetical protein
MIRRRTDLVLSMTLAEIFLLLLFLVWLGNVGQGVNDPELRVLQLEREREALQKENNQQKQRLEELTDEVSRLGLTVAAFRKALGIEEPVDRPEQVPGAVADAKRGSPRCFPNNVFAHVTLEDGIASLRVTAASEIVQAVGATVKAGEIVRDERAIESLMSEIRRFYSSRPKECRFDYTLFYKTKADYHDGRQQFEQRGVFYAAGLIPRSSAE